MDKSLYFIFPGKTSLKKPLFVVDSADIQIVEILQQIKQNWQSQIDNTYDILYLIQIRDFSPETRTNYKIQLTYDDKEYENINTKNSIHHFGSRYQKSEGIKFLFKSFFKSSTSNYPKDKNIISLSEEIAYIQMYFKQQNEWNETKFGYFLEDILLYLSKSSETNEKIEFDIFLFLIKSSYIDYPYILRDLLKLTKKVEDIELPSKFNIQELNDVEKISEIFYIIIDERKYDIIEDKGKNQNELFQIKENIKQYFLLYLLKYNQNELIHYIEIVNKEDSTNSKELFRLLIDNNFSKMVGHKSICLSNNSLKHLIKYCNNGDDLQRLCLYIRNIKTCIEIFKYENNLQIIFGIDRILKKKISLCYKEELNNENDLNNYAKDCEQFIDFNFNSICLNNKDILSSIESIKNIAILLAFIINNIDFIDKLKIKVKIRKNDNIIDYHHFSLIEISEIMKNANSLLELHEQQKLLTVSLEINSIEDIFKRNLSIIPSLEMISFLKSFSEHYPLIYPSLQNTLSEILHKNLIEILKKREIQNNDLFLLLLSEQKENVDYKEYINEFCNLISFQEINDSFVNNYHQVVKRFFSINNNALKIFYKKLITLSVKTTFIELFNLLQTIKSDVKNNQSIIQDVIICAKDKFCELIKKQEDKEDKDIKHISLCFQNFFDLGVKIQDVESIIIDIIEHLKIYLYENEIDIILCDLNKLKIIGNEKIKRIIIEKFLPTLNELSPESFANLFLEYKGSPQLLELIFNKEKDLVINANDFFTQNSKFNLFVLFVKNNMFEFKDSFTKFRNIKYFKNTLQQVQTIQNLLSDKLFTFNDVKAMYDMIKDDVFENNLLYLYLNNQPPNLFVNKLKSTINQFIKYEKAICNLIAFNKFFYKDKKEKNIEIENLLELLNKNSIKELLNQEERFESINKQNKETEQYSHLLNNKFFNIIYKQIVSDNENVKMQEAMKTFKSLKNLLDINSYKNIKPQLINDLINCCTEEEIHQEFCFLETYFKNEKQNKIEEVKRIFISGVNKINILKVVESTLMLCKEYKVKETKFIQRYKDIRNKLKNEEISIENLQEIENSLNEDKLHKDDQEQQCKQLLLIIHNQEYFFEFVRDKTRESIHQLNDYIGDIDDQQLYPGDIPILEDVVFFCESLRNFKEKPDTTFLTKFRNLAIQEKIGERFQLSIQKLFSLKDLYDKLANKENFTIEKIEQILNYSIFSIKCNLNYEENVDCKIKYNEKQNREISLKEILELRNRARLQNKKMQNDKNIENSLIFINLIRNINKLLNVINQLVIKGDVKLHQYLIKVVNKKMQILNDDGTENNTTLDTIIQDNQKRLETIIASQKLMYQKENKLELTFLYGKNILQLSQFIKSKGLEGETQIEHFCKYLTDNRVDVLKLQQILKTYNNNFNTDNIQEFIENCLGNFLKRILEESNTTINNIFTNSLIKTNLKVEPGLYTSYLDPIELEENLMKIYIYFTNHLPKPQTLLFCNKDTTIEEITAFIYRALSYPKQVFFGITHTELLPLYIREEILKIIESELKKISNMKALLVLFYQEMNLDLKNELNQKKIAKILDKSKFNETKINKFFNIQLVSSNASGVGKSFYIKSTAKKNKQNYLYFPIGGDFSREDIIKRLQNIRTQTEKTLIHLDIHETKKIPLMKDFLFSFIVLGSYSYKHLIFYLDNNIEIMIEIPYGYFDYLHLYPILRLTCDVLTISKEILEYQISSNLLSNEQIVCNLLDLFEKEKINTHVIQHKEFTHYPDSFQRFKKLVIDKPLPQNICNNILKNFYTKTNLINPSFYQQKIFISILATQFKCFLQSLYLDPNLLQTNGKRKKNPDLYLIRSKIIDCFIQLTQHFTKGAYNKYLTENSVYKTQKKQYETNKADEKGLKDLLIKEKVSFKNINPSLLLFGQDGQSLSVITTIKKNSQDKKELQEYQLFKDLINSSSFDNNKELNDYEQKENKDFLEELVKILNIKKSSFDQNELKRNGLEFPKESKKKVDFLQQYIGSFVFTADNFAKLILILLRIRAKIPVILMGETGCGKTFLVRTMSKLYGSNLKILNIHAGITENDIIAFLERESLFQNMINDTNKRQTWVFLDEINTCNALGLISEIMIKNSAQGRLLSSNLIFIGACNPYREPTKNSINCGLSYFNQQKRIKLVYTVNLLPHSLLNYVMDFGNIDSEDEFKYIESMVKQPLEKQIEKFNLKEENAKKYQNQAIKAIQLCHDFLKENNDVSVVSLREVKRFIIFFEWFVDYLLIKMKDDCYKKNANSTYFQLYYKKESPDNYLLIKLSINLSIYVCYYLRLSSDEKRKELIQLLNKIFKEQSFIKFPLEDSLDIANRVDIPKGTALNSAFLDNLYCSFVCINAKVPLIICGKPGCSKSFAIKVLLNSLKGKFSNDNLFKQLPRVYVTSYQGSKTNTSESVLFAFNKTRDIIKKYQDNLKEQIISLLFFDEIGLAEISENNPLKVIHSQLEYDDNEYKIAFIGISNWTLDASKMNRCVFLSIIDPNEKDLIDTSLNIAESFRAGLSKEPNNLKRLTNLAKTYYQYKHDRNYEKEFYDFHGLRDFYHLIKCVCQGLIQSPNNRYLETMSIEKNLGGLSFSLELAKTKYAAINKNNNSAISRNYNVLELIKQNILNEEKITNSKNSQVSQKEYFYEQRFLLIFKESQNIQIIIESLIRELQKEYVFYIGSQFSDDKFSQEYNVKMLSKIKQSTEEGKIIFLYDLEYLYPSYYDVFNQNYTIRDGKKYAKILVETNECVQTNINNKTRFVLLFDKKCLKNKNTLPDIPLLNRFEKHILSYDDLIPNSYKSYPNKIIELLDQIKSFKDQIDENDIVLNPKNLLINCDSEEIKSIVYKVTKQNTVQINTVICQVLEKITNLFPQDLFAIINLLKISKNKPLVNMIYNLYEKKSNINCSIQKYLENTSYKKSIIYTFTPILKSFNSLSCESEFSNKEKQKITINTIKLITMNSILKEAEIEKILFDFYTDPIQNVCFIKFTPLDVIYLQSIKNLIDNFEIENEYLIQNFKFKKFVFIIYLQKMLINEDISDSNKNTLTMEGQFLSHITPDYYQIIIDDLFPQQEDLNISFIKYLNENNKELLQLIDKEDIFKNEFNYCLEFIKYTELSQFPDKAIQNINQYKQELQKAILNNKDFQSLIIKLIFELSEKSESFINTVFYKKNKAFTIYYISFLEIFKNYLKRQFIDLFIKVLYILETEGNCYSIVMNNDCKNEKLKEYNKSQLKNFHLDNNDSISDEIYFYPGTKVFQSFKKIKLIQNILFPSLKAFIIIHNKIRNKKEEENNIFEDLTSIKEKIDNKLTLYFSDQYEEFQEEILYDYIKFYLCSGGLSETNFFEQLILFLLQIKFKNTDSIKLSEKIFWLEVNKEYIIHICLMYREFIDESQSMIPFFDDIKQSANRIKEEYNQKIHELNEGLFEVSEALLEILLKPNKISENINKLIFVFHTMKFLNETLNFNSNYFNQWEIFMTTYEFFPKEEANVSIQKFIEKDSLEDRLQFLEDNFKNSENYIEFMLNILQAEYLGIRENKEDNLHIIINHIFKDFSLVLKSKSIFYLILYDTDENFELPSINNDNENEDNDIDYEIFEKVQSNNNIKELFKYLEEFKDDKDYKKKYFIIEDHFLFIFEIIIYEFFDNLIKTSVGQSIGQEKREKEANIISIQSGNPNITFELLKQAIKIIKESMIQDTKDYSISFLYAISYVKIYLEFLVKFINTHKEELGNISEIIHEVLNFGGEKHDTLKKGIFYYILKLFDKNSITFQNIINMDWSEWGSDYQDIIEECKDNFIEMDFPFFDNADNYNILQNNFYIGNDSNLDNNDEWNSVEFINFLFNHDFPLLLSKSSIVHENEDDKLTNNINKFIKKYFDKNKNLCSCFDLFSWHNKNQKVFIQDITHLTQRDYFKLLHCFYFIVIILHKKDEKTLNSLYKELHKTFIKKKPLFPDYFENIKVVFYYSFNFFKKYLPFLQSEETINSKSETIINPLNKLIEYLNEIETILEVPIEIFLHLFYKKYIISFNMEKALNETKNNLQSFTNQYQEDCNRIFQIQQTDLKSIIREMFNPLEYEDNEFLKYFLLSNKIILDEQKENFIILEKKDMFPLLFYSYNNEEREKILQLKHLNNFNLFGREILEYFTINKLPKKTALSTEIDFFLSKDNEKEFQRKTYFEHFQTSWKSFHHLSATTTNFTQQENPPIVDKTSNILYCLPEKNEGEKGYFLTKALKQCIYIQNEYINKIIEYLKSSYPSEKFDYLVIQLSQNINIQEASDNDIINFDIPPNRLHFHKLLDMFKFYTERRYFNLDGNFISKSCRNSYVDYKTLHEKLIRLLFQGKHKFSDNIKYVNFISVETDLKIQEDLNRKKENENKFIMSKLF